MNKVVIGIIGLVILIGLAFYLMQDTNDTADEIMNEDDQIQDGETPSTNTVELRENTSGENVTVARTTLTQPSYVVIYRIDAEGVVTVVGSSDLLPAGEHHDVEIELDAAVDAEATLVAALHSDNGDGVFNENNDLPVTTASGFVTDVDVVDVAADEEDTTLAGNIDAYLEATESNDEGIGDASNADVAEFTINAENYSFSEETITVQEGQTVRITLVNDGGLHDLVIDEFEGAQTERVQTGERTTIEFVADQAGSFAFYCSVGQHRELGMEGTLVVE